MAENIIKINVDDSSEDCPASSSPSGSLISSTNSPSRGSLSSTETSNLSATLPTSCSRISTKSLTSELYPSEEDLERMGEIVAELNSQLKEEFEKQKARKSAEDDWSDYNPCTARKVSMEYFRDETYRWMSSLSDNLHYIKTNCRYIKFFIESENDDKDSFQEQDFCSYEQMKQFIADKYRSGEELKMNIPPEFEATFKTLAELRWELFLLRKINLEFSDDLMKSCEIMMRWVVHFASQIRDEELDYQIFTPHLAKTVKDYWQHVYDTDRRISNLMEANEELSILYSNENMGNADRIVFFKIVKRKHDFIYSVTLNGMLLLNEDFQNSISLLLPSTVWE